MLSFALLVILYSKLVRLQARINIELPILKRKYSQKVYYLQHKETVQKLQYIFSSSLNNIESVF